MTPEARRVLELRRSISQAANAKYQAVLNQEVDGRIFEMFRFCGAQRTGRWSGRALQLQNLKRPPPGQNNDDVAIAVRGGTFNTKYGGPKALETLGGAIRAVIAAPEGKVFVVRDYSNIESRVLGWVCNDCNLQQVFNNGLDPYKDFATHWLMKPYDEVTKEERNQSKPPALGCGYGLGWKGLIKYADSMGVELSESQAGTAVDTFRTVYAGIPRTWKFVEQAFETAIAGHPTDKNRLKFYKDKDMVVIELPSGRNLYYYKARIDPTARKIEYLGQNQYTRKWEWVTTWGGKLIENIIQATARDILAHGMKLTEQNKLDIIFHVHDEIGIEAEEAFANQAMETLQCSMDTVPKWARGLFLESEGYITKRYRKD